MVFDVNLKFLQKMIDINVLLKVLRFNNSLEDFNKAIIGYIRIISATQTLGHQRFEIGNFAHR